MGMPVINRDRLAQSFVDLVKIDSVSKEEAGLCRFLKEQLADLGVETLVDDAGHAVGSDTGNLIGRFKGSRGNQPLLLSAHMDTVAPGIGVRPVFEEGIFYSSGDTILGADDKAGIAIIMEALRCIEEGNLPSGPLELVFSIWLNTGLWRGCWGPVARRCTRLKNRWHWTIWCGRHGCWWRLSVFMLKNIHERP
jgi:tripeptide aminopeptidase